jgi:hypothetical protein
MKKRTSKNVWKGIPAILLLTVMLIFGMTVAGCGDDDPGQKSPEEKTTAERWWVWSDASAKAKVTHSVANDDVCTVTVSGTVDERWKASPRYDYTGKKDISYVYKFEAWTQSGERELGVQYYDNWGEGDGPFLGTSIWIDTTRTTYTIEGVPLPKAGVPNLSFQCADQLGTFYIKVISITEYKGSFLTITGIPADNNFKWSSVNIFGDGVDVVVWGGNNISGRQVTFALTGDDGSSWKKAGKYFIMFNIDNWGEFLSVYLYTGGKELDILSDTDQLKYTFTGGSSHTINFNQFKHYYSSNWEDGEEDNWWGDKDPSLPEEPGDGGY